MSGRLAGRVAIVTGGGAGLGRAHAMALAAAGARVVVLDLGEASAGVVAEIAATGGEAVAATASVTDPDAVAAAIADTLAWGRIDILVNNAGILRDRSFAKATLDEFRQVLDVHVMGAVICTKAVWDTMRAQGHGRIVLTTSSSGLFGNFGQANYAAAKMALVGLMQTLAIEGAKHGIRVNCLAPTAATAMTGALLAADVAALFAPERLAPGLLRLVGDDAPTRLILCGGAGHFARAFVGLTPGAFLGDAGEADWSQVDDPAGATVPDAGVAQLAAEHASALRAAGPER